MENTDRIREKAIRLFTYLKELATLRSKTIYNLEEYEKVLWLADIPRESGCYCAAWDIDFGQDSDTWVQIQKPRLLPPPEPPSQLAPWLVPGQVENSSLEFPELQERIVVESADKKGETANSRLVYENLDNHPEIEKMWEEYVENSWWPWAEKDRKLRPIQDFYTDLFSIYQKQQRLGEAYEVVLGLGLLVWKTSQPIYRHLLVAQTNLSFDAQRGIITVTPAAEGVKLSLEQDMLGAEDRPDVSEQKKLEEQIAEIGDEIWDRVKLEGMLKSWIYSVSPKGQFNAVLQPPPQTQIGPTPQLYLAPALILRKRSERNLIRIYEEIVEQLNQGGEITLGVKRLVEIVDDRSPSLQNPEDDQGEIYFPLPSNEEQKEIIQRLATRQGVLVQGPPGTGKSHTIVNIVCHLLAIGQRILVTSHTARALRVLHSKFPDKIKNLCVSLLGDDRDALQNLEDSVQGITERYNHWDPKKSQRNILELERRLGLAREREAKILSELRILREAETYPHSLPFGQYRGTLAEISLRLRKEESKYSWIKVRPLVETEPPLSNEEALTLLRLLRELDEKKIGEIQKDIIPSEKLPAPIEIADLYRQEVEAQAHLSENEKLDRHPAFAILVSVPRQSREVLSKKIAMFLDTYKAINRNLQPWTTQVITDILNGQGKVWEDRLALTQRYLNECKQNHQIEKESQVNGLENKDTALVRAHALALRQHLEAGKGLGWGIFRAKVVKESAYLWQKVYVDGYRVDNAKTIQILLEWLDATDALEGLHKLWKPYLSQSCEGPFRIQLAFYQSQQQSLEHILQLHFKLNELKELIASMPGLPEPLWSDPEDVATLLHVVQAVIYAENLAQAREPLQKVEEELKVHLLQTDSHPIIKNLLNAVRNRDEQEYSEAYRKLCLLEEWKRDLAIRNDLLERLISSRVDFIKELLANPRDTLWDERLGNFEKAWNWARADRWLGEKNNSRRDEELDAELSRCRQEIQGLMEELVAAKAWKHFFARMNEYQRQHLMAWTKAIGKIGKGTGKYASQHRYEARQHMKECRSVIPAWIMPIYRVAESIQPGIDMFDVVIVDEASQSGPEALFLHYIGKKLIIVGDDKQISPDFIGLERTDVDFLRKKFINDIPHNDALGVDNSFFDQAVIRYGGRIRLKEHFRCMPEIIQFSNNLCYHSEPLIPLRQYGGDRLAPIKLTYVPQGYRKGSGNVAINPPEAEKIAEQIIVCCQNPAYQDKSIGVISLQGIHQAREIERLLLRKLGPEEMEKRNIICGDAYDFQGDERDIIFLSLVITPNDRHRALTSDKDKRRFNVAASRARDQMWLFHSVTLDDLSPECVRYQLLSYCLNPRVEPLCAFEGVDPNSDQLVPPFESLFEQHVFCRIRARGYRVIPQVEIAGKRIDLIVEGMQGRLAVECDGDRFHNVENYEEDMARQRRLERCGLTFWRIRASVFYRNPDQALEGLWRLLEKKRIYPSVALLSPGTPGQEVTSEAAIAYEKTETNREISKHEKQGNTNNNIEGNPSASIQGQPLPVIGLTETMKAELKEEKSEDKNIFASKSDIPEVEVAPYRHWQETLLPDPRDAMLNEIMEGLLDIISIEGPMLCHRAYHLYAKAVGIRLGKIKERFNSAVRKALQSGKLLDSDEEGSQFLINRVVRTPEMPPVIIRKRGNRSLEEIPLSEIAAVMRQILIKQKEIGICAGVDEEDLFRRVLKHYDLVKMTDKAKKRLSRAFDLLREKGKGVHKILGQREKNISSRRGEGMA